MIRGYFSGDADDKLETLKKMGVENLEHAVRSDGHPPPRRSTNMCDDYPQRELAIGDLRKGDVLCVPSLRDIGTLPDEMVSVAAAVNARGAKLRVYGEPRDIAFANTDDAELLHWLCGRARDEYHQRRKEALHEGLKESGLEGGRPSIFDTHVDKKTWKQCEEIWGTDGESRRESRDRMLDILPEGVKPSFRTIERTFGTKRKAVKDAKARQNRKGK